MLFRSSGRQQLESFRLGRWASRRRRDLLELLDRLSPTIAELSQAIEQEAEKCPEAQRLMTHPGVGPLTALAFVLIIGQAERDSAQNPDDERNRNFAPTVQHGCDPWPIGECLSYSEQYSAWFRFSEPDTNILLVKPAQQKGTKCCVRDSDGGVV